MGSTSPASGGALGLRAGVERDPIAGKKRDPVPSVLRGLALGDASLIDATLGDRVTMPTASLPLRALRGDLGSGRRPRHWAAAGHDPRVHGRLCVVQECRPLGTRTVCDQPLWRCPGRHAQVGSYAEQGVP